MSLGELEKLTAGERLRIRRRRLGETQRQAADRHGVSLARYSLWERDLWPATGIPKVSLGRLEPHERCLLYRLRAGTPQWKIAEDLGRCRYWVNKMERGEEPCDELIAYWEC